MHRRSQWNEIGYRRSAAFSQYLYQQTPERRKELLAQERAYLKSRETSSRIQVVARDFKQVMVGVDAT
jgi:hypothetical protein